MIRPDEILTIIRSASFNDEVAHDLLLELSRSAPNSNAVYRVLDVMAHMAHDAIVLEQLYQELERGNLRILQTKALN